eukprot:6221187-Prymnesium_polylepis.1
MANLNTMMPARWTSCAQSSHSSDVQTDGLCVCVCVQARVAGEAEPEAELGGVRRHVHQSGTVRAEGPTATRAATSMSLGSRSNNQERCPGGAPARARPCGCARSHFGTTLPAASQ